MKLTRLIVVDDSRADDFTARREDLLKFLLSESSRKSTDVDVRFFDTFAAWTGV